MTARRRRCAGQLQLTLWPPGGNANAPVAGRGGSGVKAAGGHASAFTIDPSTPNWWTIQLAIGDRYARAARMAAWHKATRRWRLSTLRAMALDAEALGLYEYAIEYWQLHDELAPFVGNPDFTQRRRRAA